MKKHFKVILSGTFTFGTLIYAEDEDEAVVFAGNELHDIAGGDVFLEVNDTIVELLEEDPNA